MKDDYTSKTILKLIRQIAQALHHLHYNKIVLCNFSDDSIIFDGLVPSLTNLSQIRFKGLLNINKVLKGRRGEIHNMH